MAAELNVAFVVMATVGFAYVAIFPRLAVKSLRRMMVIDLALSAFVLVAVGSVYAGSGIGFSLIVVEVPWWVFALVIGTLTEAPLFYWFCRRYDVDFGDDLDD